MAEVIAEARARREEARRLRTESVALRLANRELFRIARARMAAAHEARFHLEGALDAPQPSPWSALFWRCRDAELERVLVPVD